LHSLNKSETIWTVSKKAIKCELPGTLHRSLTSKAKIRGVSLSDIIREALWQYIRENQAK